jgi:hypothetical protein
LYEAKAVTEQYAGSFGGHGSNAFYLEAFLPLHRLDGGVDTAHFRSVRPWFAPPYWELLEVQYGVAQKDAAAAAAEREKIRHINLLRARLATARLQGSMFAIVGGIGGIVEGAPLLGTLEAAAGVEQGGLAVADLATGKEHEALSARAIQAALEAAGLDTETARFLNSST